VRSRGQSELESLDDRLNKWEGFSAMGENAAGLAVRLYLLKLGLGGGLLEVDLIMPQFSMRHDESSPCADRIN